MVIKGHEAKEHRDAVSAAKQTPKPKVKKPTPKSKKEAAEERQAQTNAASIWGDGNMPFGKKKPQGLHLTHSENSAQLACSH